jgi:hypothetical protein
MTYSLIIIFDNILSIDIRDIKSAASTDMSWGFNVMSEENYKRLMSQFVDIFKGLHGVLEKESEKAPSTRDWYRRHHFESVVGAAVTAKGKEGTVDGTSTDNNI